MGAKYYWAVDVQTTPGGTTYETVPNVQAISIDYGRSQPTDDFPAGQLSISGNLPDSLPAAFKVVKSLVRVKLYSNAGVLKLTRFFSVRSLTRTYGTKPNLDTWTFNGIGALVELGEQQLTSDYSTTAGTRTGLALADLLSVYSIGSGVQPGSSVVSGTTYTTGTYLNDIAQTIARTEQGRLIDSEDSAIQFSDRNGIVTSVNFVYFNDETVAAPTVTPYTSVQFLNDGEYLANTVIVAPDGLADQVVGTTKPVLNFDTLDQTTTQAADLAQYIKNTLDFNTVRPSSLVFNFDAQSNETFLFSLFCGTQVRIDLRGVSYSCVVEGVAISANPSTTVAEVRVSSADAYRFLRLDDVTFGTLDNNRLGF